MRAALRAVAVLVVLQGCAIVPKPPPEPTSALALSFSPTLHSSLIAIVEDNARYSLEAGELRTIEDQVLGILVNRGYSVASQSERDRAIDELGFQRSGWTDRDLVKIGSMLNAKAVLIISVDESNADSSRSFPSWFDASACVSGRLSSVETSELLWVGRFCYSRVIQEEGDLLSMAINHLSWSFPWPRSNASASQAPSIGFPAIASEGAVGVVVEDLTRDLEDGDLQQAEDEVAVRLLNVGFKVSSRADQDELFNELRFQRRGYSESDIARVGRMLNIAYFFVVSVNSVSVEQATDSYSKPVLGTVTMSASGFDVRASVSARLVSVAQGRIIKVTSVEYETRVKDEAQSGVGAAVAAGEAVKRLVASLPRG